MPITNVKPMQVSQQVVEGQKQVEAKGIVGVFTGEQDGRKVGIVVFDLDYKDPENLVGTVKSRADGSRYTVDRSTGATLTNGGVGRWQSGAEFQTGTLELKFRHRDGAAKGKARKAYAPPSFSQSF